MIHKSKKILLTQNYENTEKLVEVYNFIYCYDKPVMTKSMCQISCDIVLGSQVSSFCDSECPQSKHTPHRKTFAENQNILWRR